MHIGGCCLYHNCVHVEIHGGTVMYVYFLVLRYVLPLSSNVVYFNDVPIQMGGISKTNPKLKHHLVWKYSVELYIAAKILYEYVHVLLLLGIISRYEIMALDGSCLGKS